MMVGMMGMSRMMAGQHAPPGGPSSSLNARVDNLERRFAELERRFRQLEQRVGKQSPFLDQPRRTDAKKSGPRGERLPLDDVPQAK
jgi:hypothetical protein